SDADIRVPLAAVALDQAQTVRLMPRSADGGRVPVYDVPGAAAAALAHAARYGTWRTGPHGQIPSLPGIRAVDARALVTEFLPRAPGGRLPPGEPADLLRCYGIRLAGPLAAEDTAAAAGPEMRIGVTHDRVFGPLVVLDCGAGAARLTPLTDT